MSVRRSPGCTRVGEMFVRYGLVTFKRMELLVPFVVLIVRLPGGVLMGTRKRIARLDQEVNEVIGTEPIRTELLPREEPKFSPLTVTTLFVLAFCGETPLIQGEVTVSRAVSLPPEVTTCRSPVRAPDGTRTRIWVSLQLTYWEELGIPLPKKTTRLVPRLTPKAVPRMVTT